MISKDFVEVVSEQPKKSKNGTTQAKTAGKKSSPPVKKGKETTKSKKT
jgi:hypothetical protein